MENIDVEVDGNILTLRIDLDHECGFTERFRSMRIGSTKGNIHLWVDGKPHPKGIRINCNVFRGLTEEEKKEAERLYNSSW